MPDVRGDGRKDLRGEVGGRGKQWTAWREAWPPPRCWTRPRGSAGATQPHRQRRIGGNGGPGPQPGDRGCGGGDLAFGTPALSIASDFANNTILACVESPGLPLIAEHDVAHDWLPG